MMNENWRGDNKRHRQSRNGGHARTRRPYGDHSEQSSGEQPQRNGNNLGTSAYKKTGKEGKENEKNNKNLNPRLKWTSVKLRTDPIPTPECPYCGEPIKDLASAFSGANGKAVHFECVQKHIAAAESLEKGDTVVYIGGGRFGVVYFDNQQIPRAFKIKKVIEWEQKDSRASWRGHIADHFSLT
jgi:hypothetical protein